MVRIKVDRGVVLPGHIGKSGSLALNMLQQSLQEVDLGLSIHWRSSSLVVPFDISPRPTEQRDQLARCGRFEIGYLLTDAVPYHMPYHATIRCRITNLRGSYEG